MLPPRVLRTRVAEVEVEKALELQETARETGRLPPRAVLLQEQYGRVRQVLQTGMSQPDWSAAASQSGYTHSAVTRPVALLTVQLVYLYGMPTQLILLTLQTKGLKFVVCLILKGTLNNQLYTLIVHCSRLLFHLI